MSQQVHVEEAWGGPELDARSDWRVALSPAELSELAAPSSDPAPSLKARMQSVAALLESGPGVVLMSALPVAEWGRDTSAEVLLALGRGLGTPVSQSAEGVRIFDVRDEGFAPDDPRFRGPSSSRKLRFHTDRCDVIGFLCLRPALEGGENQIVSSPRLYAELQKTRPDLLRVLCEPFPYLRHTVDRGNTRAFCSLPVFSFREGRFAGHVLRVLIDRADRSDAAPSLTHLQREALDALDEVAARRELQLRLTLRSGDLLLINNWTTFHRRTAFVDAEDRSEGRHLLRIWISMRNSRPLVEDFRVHFGAVEAGALRGGMCPSFR